MADNTLLNTGAGGDTIASDDISGVKFQRVKLVHGADGVNAGDVATVNPLPVIHMTTLGVPTYSGRSATFRTPGIAGTAGQKIFAIHNATGSTKIVQVNYIRVDCVATVVKAVTVLPPLIRIHRVTVLPTNGTAGSKTAKDTALTSNASVTVFQGASADGTASGTALTATIPAGSIVGQEFMPRLITAAGYEVADRIGFLENTSPIILRALEGVVVFLDYTLVTQNVATDMWTVSCDWDEF